MRENEGAYKIGPKLLSSVTENNARNLVLQLRRLADQAEGDQRRQLRDLAVRMETIARQISELA